MRRSSVCGKWLRPQKDEVYLVPITAVINLNSEYHECTDCPRCGCQTILNTRFGRRPTSSKANEGAVRK